MNITSKMLILALSITGLGNNLLWTMNYSNESSSSSGEAIKDAKQDLIKIAENDSVGSDSTESGSTSHDQIPHQENLSKSQKKRNRKKNKKAKQSTSILQEIPTHVTSRTPMRLVGNNITERAPSSEAGPSNYNSFNNNDANIYKNSQKSIASKYEILRSAEPRIISLRKPYVLYLEDNDSYKTVDEEPTKYFTYTRAFKKLFKLNTSSEHTCEANFTQLIGEFPIALSKTAHALEAMSQGYKINDEEIQKINRIILYGPPGNGKTTLINDLAQHTDSSLFYLVGSNVCNNFQYGGVETINNLINDAVLKTKETLKPVIILIDEIDLFTKTSAIDDPKSELSAASTQLWAKLDSIKDNKYIIVVGITNHLEKINPTFQSRFGHKIELKNPNCEQREKLLITYLEKAKIKLHPNTIKIIAKDSSLFSARDIELFITQVLATELDWAKIKNIKLSGNDIINIFDIILKTHKLIWDEENNKYEREALARGEITPRAYFRRLFMVASETAVSTIVSTAISGSMGLAYQWIQLQTIEPIRTGNQINAAVIQRNLNNLPGAYIKDGHIHWTSKESRTSAALTYFKNLRTWPNACKEIWNIKNGLSKEIHHSRPITEKNSWSGRQTNSLAGEEISTIANEQADAIANRRSWEGSRAMGTVGILGAGAVAGGGIVFTALVLKVGLINAIAIISGTIATPILANTAKSFISE